MSQDIPDLDKFCFKIVRNSSSLFLGIVYLPLLLLFLILAFYLHHKHSRDITNVMAALVYLLLILWCLFSISEVVLAFIAFANKNSDKLEFILFFVSFTSLFLLHTALMIAIYNWHNNFLAFCAFHDRTSGLSGSKLLLQERERRQSNDEKIRKYLKGYLIIRQIILFVWGMFMIEFCLEDANKKRKISFATLIMVCIDSYLLFVVFVFGYWSLRRNEKLKQLLPERQYHNLSTNYLFLAMSSFLRAIIYTIRTFNIFEGYQIEFSNCSNQQSTQTHKKYAKEMIIFIILFIEAFLIDFISASNILGIYNTIEHENTERHQNQNDSASSLQY